MRQPIGSLLHGALDYLTGTSLIAASRLPTLTGSFAGRALLAAGANHLAYSAVTDYELAVVRKLPYKAHLALDALGALGLVAAGATRQDPFDRYIPMGVGLYELSAVLMSDPSGGGHALERHAVTVNRPEAEVRSFISDPANVRRFAPDGSWSGRYELRPAPGDRGTEVRVELVYDVPGGSAGATVARLLGEDPHQQVEDDLRRFKQVMEAGEVTRSDGSPGGTSAARQRLQRPAAPVSH